MQLCQSSAKVAELSTRHLDTPDACDNQRERYVLQRPEHETLKPCPDRSHAEMLFIIFKEFLEISVGNFRSGRM